MLNILLLGTIDERVRQINCFSYETAFQNMRNHSLDGRQLDYFWQAADGDVKLYSELLTMYFASEDDNMDAKELKENISYVKKYHPEDFERIETAVYAVWKDLKQFPVGKVSDMPDATVTFENSWMQSRTFGGERGHEGCDIMASVNQRGIYPIYSMTDGVIENIGWLKLGGYRIGIRSESGAYFYYAHMSEYAKDFQIGERVKAGTHLGFMGDTGYSEIPGTTGNFAVHLHLGIYMNDENGKEYSINSYPMLWYLFHMDGA